MLRTTHDKPDIVIASDSLCSLYQIRNVLRQEHKAWGHRHEHLLLAICKELIWREQKGFFTRLIKVRAHSGIDGNERADVLAKRAAESKHASTIETAKDDEKGFCWCKPSDDPDINIPVRDRARVEEIVQDAAIKRSCAEKPSFLPPYSMGRKLRDQWPHS